MRTQGWRIIGLNEDYEIWEPKLPLDYKRIINTSKAKYIYLSSDILKKYLYDMISKGILLQNDTVLFSLGSNGERNEMISAKDFSYKNYTSHKWRSVPESRFPKVLKMLDSSNLKIQIKITSQFLSPSVHYKVHLIFRFCGTKKSQAKRMYVNLKYKMGNESVQAYFATWREDGWMMITLFQFLNHQKNTDFEVLLESFSRCYCGRHSVYIEGIQFQAIDNVEHEEIDKLKEVQQVFLSKLKTDKLWPIKMKVKKDHMTWFSLSQIEREKDKLLYAKKVVYDYTDVAIQSRFRGAIEFLREQISKC
ncbi:hypothetical protein L1987_74673 [Smallanthus sonchifolius]|uniref:Uncharacterized protein n=1 Tax=Smallanthus sonchifolius TaxID=185202 RepID=A0ACB9A3R0_9ASTR|nr:hypothetical protein L1987_74673 [Smallanthus sonchifolius]